jgi:2-polyprenyl-3-methyl-5-hydroxy-6-metoxy-1,4-benzoquinol methylase
MIKEDATPLRAPAGPGPDETLHARRAAAAEESGGISNDTVYAAIERELAGLGAAGDLLDFGSGTGQFTTRLRDAGRYRSVTGADLFPRAATLSADIRWVQGDLNDVLPLPDRSFDVVVAAEVIEHLENPRAVCREIFRLLRPGGIAVITTPNNESWRSIIALVVRGHFVAFGASAYPAHITPLVRQDLDHVLAEAGFSDRSFSFSDVGGVPGMPMRTWQSLVGPWARGLRFSDNVIVTARKPAA